MAIDAVVAHTLFYNAKDGKLSPAFNIYWQINPNTLHYSTNSEKKIAANIKTDITFSNEAGIIKHDQYILQTVPRASIDEIMQYSIIELRSYDLPAGAIKISMVLTDLADSINRFTFRDSIKIAPPSGTVSYSGIEFLDTMYESGIQNKFSRNGRQLIPFCANFFDDDIKRLRYYAELYGTDKVANTDYPLVQTAAISRNEREGSYGDLLKVDTFRSPVTFSAAHGSFDLAPLPSGNYFLRIALQNNANEVIASSALFFQRLNKHPYIPPPDTTKKNIITDTGIQDVKVLNLNKTFVAKYDLAQVKAILKMLLPVSDKNAKQSINGFLKKPDEVYMRYFIYNYFAAINTKDPGKAWKEFAAKIAEVNKKFNTHNTPGYETERGFIYLRYGPPTDIITVENEQGSRPYEIWQYNVITEQNNRARADAVFLFYKPDEILDDYRLLHSNVTGEVQNAQWRFVIRAGTLQTNQIGETRAEQYIGNK
ncbi:MAG: hypothetical protein K0Q79_2420 [Flavipsychrobacter sp.]|nr:hypothetical protein [Flavipsychrobacter sp.]